MKITIKNPAKSRPLSANVRRLMTMARESPLNPDVEKITRKFSARDLAYCDMQGSVFMAAIDRGVRMEVFAPLYMTSQLAGVMDHSFSVAGGMESDDLSGLLQVPMAFGARRFSALLLHVVPAEMHGEGGIRESPAHMFRRNPILWIVRMIVITIHAQTVCGSEIGVRAIAVFVGDANVIATDRPAQADRILNYCFVRIAAVAGYARAVGVIKPDFCHQ